MRSDIDCVFDIQTRARLAAPGAIGSVTGVNLQASEQAFAAVQSELAQERADALSRAGHKVQVEFDRCHRLLAQIDRHDHGHDRRHELLAEYREARAAFEHRRWQLHVHREAIGLNDHRWVDRVFPTPERR